MAKFSATGALLWANAVLSNADGAGALGMATGVAPRSGGFVWITGRLYGATDFSGGLGSAITTSSGDSDAFVARFDAAGVLMKRTLGSSPRG